MKKVFAILFVMLLLQGCVSPPRAPFVPSTGAIYTNIKAPLKINYDKTKYSDLSGQASTVHIALYYFSFAFGDASLKQALKDGLLEKADYVDYEWTSVLGMFGRLTVRAYGQN
ncbi:MAG: hypothetical protein J6Y85_03945 [Alphaproteobacteria bacterium]|nr:hypothetical protein [Alphaproteobacteria bacterium]